MQKWNEIKFLFTILNTLSQNSALPCQFQKYRCFRLTHGELFLAARYLARLPEPWHCLRIFHMQRSRFSMGYSRKYPQPPLWTTLNWVLKNFRISKNDSSSFCRIPNLAGCKSWGIPEFCNTLNGFRGNPVKVHKILGKFMKFQSCSPSIFCRISNVVHWGCVDIFWNSPM